MKSLKIFKELHDQVSSHLTKQAKNITTFKVRFSSANVIETIQVKISEVDMNESDSRNIIGVIISKDDKNLYKLVQNIEF